MAKTRIVLGVTGSIAVYKAAELVRLMVKADWQVRVVMTRNATQFVTPLTFQTLSRNDVSVESFAPVTWNPNHIALAQDADLMLVAPATANVIAKIDLGLADDLLTSTALATRAPIAIAPAMNDGMWANPIVQQHIDNLRARGVNVLTPGFGELACGTVGLGRMAEPPDIVACIQKQLGL